MKKTVIKLAIFALLVVAVDMLVGVGADFLRSHTKGGETGRLIYINNNTEEDLLVVGSSRAIHHYNPEILEDETGLSVYNAGTDGNGILLFYMQLCNILRHHTPKFIIYDFQYSFDLSADDHSKYLNLQKPFYGQNQQVDSVFLAVDWRNKYKNLSQAYIHNSKLPQYISDFIRPLEPNIKGYKPLNGQMTPGQFQATSYQTLDVDSVKRDYINSYIRLCREHEVGLAFVVSPLYFPSDKNVTVEPIAQIARENGVRMLDFSDSDAFLGNDSLFVDPTHLNAAGADLLTKMVADSLREDISLRSQH